MSTIIAKTNRKMGGHCHCDVMNDHGTAAFGMASSPNQPSNGAKAKQQSIAFLSFPFTPPTTHNDSTGSLLL